MPLVLLGDLYVSHITATRERNKRDGYLFLVLRVTNRDSVAVLTRFHWLTVLIPGLNYNL